MTGPFAHRASCPFQSALDYVDERSGTNSTTGSVTGSCSNHSTDGTNAQQGALIFLHAGTYRGEFLVIDSDISLIGKSAHKIKSVGSSGI